MLLSRFIKPFFVASSEIRSIEDVAFLLLLLALILGVLSGCVAFKGPGDDDDNDGLWTFKRDRADFMGIEDLASFNFLPFFAFSFIFCKAKGETQLLDNNYCWLLRSAISQENEIGATIEHSW